MDHPDSPEDAPAEPAGLTGMDVLAILVSAFLIIVAMNAALIHFATDDAANFRELIDWLC